MNKKNQKISFRIGLLEKGEQNSLLSIEKKIKKEFLIKFCEEHKIKFIYKDKVEKETIHKIEKKIEEIEEIEEKTKQSLKNCKNDNTKWIENLEQIILKYYGRILFKQYSINLKIKEKSSPVNINIYIQTPSKEFQKLEWVDWLHEEFQNANNNNDDDDKEWENLKEQNSSRINQTFSSIVFFEFDESLFFDFAKLVPEINEWFNKNKNINVENIWDKLFEYLKIKEDIPSKSEKILQNELIHIEPLIEKNVSIDLSVKENDKSEKSKIIMYALFGQNNSIRNLFFNSSDNQFGLRIALNLIGSDKFKQINKTKFSTIADNDNISYYKKMINPLYTAFDDTTELVESVRGKCDNKLDRLNDFIKKEQLMIEGNSIISYQYDKVNIKTLIYHLTLLYFYYKIRYCEERFPIIFNIEKIAEKSIIQNLENIFLNLVNSKPESFTFSPPVQIDYETQYISLSRKESKIINLDSNENFFEEWVKKYTEKNEKVKIEDLKDNRIYINNYNSEEEIGHFSIFNSLYCECKYDKKDYFLIKGNWYYFKKEFWDIVNSKIKNKIENMSNNNNLSKYDFNIQKIYSDLFDYGKYYKFPTLKPYREYLYNWNFWINEDNVKTTLLFDRDLLHFKSEEENNEVQNHDGKIEFADLITKDEFSVNQYCHVKIIDDNKKNYNLSYLINQGFYSMVSLDSSSDFFNRVNKEIEKKMEFENNFLSENYKHNCDFTIRDKISNSKKNNSLIYILIYNSSNKKIPRICLIQLYSFILRAPHFNFDIKIIQPNIKKETIDFNHVKKFLLNNKKKFPNYNLKIRQKEKETPKKEWNQEGYVYMEEIGKSIFSKETRNDKLLQGIFYSHNNNLYYVLKHALLDETSIELQYYFVINGIKIPKLDNYYLYESDKEKIDFFNFDLVCRFQLNEKINNQKTIMKIIKNSNNLVKKTFTKENKKKNEENLFSILDKEKISIVDLKQIGILIQRGTCEEKFFKQSNNENIKLEENEKHIGTFFEDNDKKYYFYKLNESNENFGWAIQKSKYIRFEQKKFIIKYQNDIDTGIYKNTKRAKRISFLQWDQFIKFQLSIIIDKLS